MNEAFELDIKPAQPLPKTNKKIKYVDGKTYEYEIFKLIDEYDPILKEHAEFFDFDKPFMNPQYLALSLLETMKFRRGIGLAAPQVGLKTRVFVMGGADGVGYSMFNPIVLDTKGESKFDEGCLSFPGLYLPIKRAEEVTVAYFDFSGQTHEKTFNGLTARVILHELDHLDGICFTSLVPQVTLERRKQKVKKNLKLLKRQREQDDKDQLIREAVKNLYLEGLQKKTINVAPVT